MCGTDDIISMSGRIPRVKKKQKCLNRLEFCILHHKQLSRAARRKFTAMRAQSLVRNISACACRIFKHAYSEKCKKRSPQGGLHKGKFLESSKENQPLDEAKNIHLSVLGIFGMPSSAGRVTPALRAVVRSKRIPESNRQHLRAFDVYTLHTSAQTATTT